MTESKLFLAVVSFSLYRIHDNGKHLDTIPSTIYNIQGISFRLRYYSCPATSASVTVNPFYATALFLNRLKIKNARFSDVFKW